MRIGFIGLGAMGLPMAGTCSRPATRSPSPRGAGGRSTRRSRWAQSTAGSPRGWPRPSRSSSSASPTRPRWSRWSTPCCRRSDRARWWSTARPSIPTWSGPNTPGRRRPGRAFSTRPLSGGTAGAQKGTLTLMVGGDADDPGDSPPALEPFAGLVVHVGGPGMGQVVKLCNNVIYAAQMIGHRRGDRHGAPFRAWTWTSCSRCYARHRRLRGGPHPPAGAGVIPESPASNDWQPGFMTDLMAKDLDLALAYARQCGVPVPAAAAARQLLTAASAAGYGREDFSAVAKVVFALAVLRERRGRRRRRRPAAHAGAHPGGGPPRPRRAHHRELGQALPRRPSGRPCRTATAFWPRPSRWPAWPRRATSSRVHRTYLSINRTGSGRLRLRARRPPGGHRGRGPPPTGWTGVKHMTRIDMDDPVTAAALELLGQVLEQARSTRVSRRSSSR